MEELLTLKEAALIIPGNPAPTTISKWINRGCRGVKMKHYRTGNKVFVKLSDFEKFSERVAEEHNGVKKKMYCNIVRSLSEDGYWCGFHDTEGCNVSVQGDKTLFKSVESAKKFVEKHGAILIDVIE